MAHTQAATDDKVGLGLAGLPIDKQSIALAHPALQAGGNVLNVLSAMLGAGVDQGASGGAVPVEQSQTDWGTIALVGGGLAVGGFVLWKFMK